MDSENEISYFLIKILIEEYFHVLYLLFCYPHKFGFFFK